MNQSSFQVTVASVGETYFAGSAASLYVPGVEGDMEILAGHEPFMSTLKKGTVRVTPVDGEMVDVEVNGGVLEVSNNSAVVLLS